MPSRRSTSYPRVRYSSIRDSVDSDEEQFKPAPVETPWKAIILAFLLLLFGVSLLVIAILAMTGHLESKTYQDRVASYLTLGTMMFIPGAYHVRIAYHAYRKTPGYSFEDIPEFD